MPIDDPWNEEFDPSEEEWNDMERRKEQAVFANCQVCGVKLHTEDEEKMGMCERCAAE
jgi:hypothetical protein